MARLTLRDFIMSMPYKENGFVAVRGGSLHFGNVTFAAGLLRFENCATVSYHKTIEFLEFLKILGSNIVRTDTENQEKETATIELGSGSKLEIADKTMIFKESGKSNFVLQFDHFVYIQFLKSLSQIALFMLNPSVIEFEVFQRYLNSDEAEEKKKIEKATNIRNLNEEEKFLLGEMLKCHSSFLTFCRVTNDLSAVNLP